MDGTRALLIAGFALVVGLVVGWMFSGVSVGAGMFGQTWAFLALVTGISAFVTAMAVHTVSYSILKGPIRLGAALVLGLVVSLLVGYLIQPVSGPV